jgi:hypothetical protein
MQVPDSASSWLLCEKQPTMSEDFYRLSCVPARCFEFDFIFYAALP